MKNFFVLFVFVIAALFSGIMHAPAFAAAPINPAYMAIDQDLPQETAYLQVLNRVDCMYGENFTVHKAVERARTALLTWKDGDGFRRQDGDGFHVVVLRDEDYYSALPSIRPWTCNIAKNYAVIRIPVGPLNPLQLRGFAKFSLEVGMAMKPAGRTPAIIEADADTFSRQAFCSLHPLYSDFVDERSQVSGTKYQMSLRQVEDKVETWFPGENQQVKTGLAILLRYDTCLHRLERNQPDISPSQQIQFSSQLMVAFNAPPDVASFLPFGPRIT